MRHLNMNALAIIPTTRALRRFLLPTITLLLLNMLVVLVGCRREPAETPDIPIMTIDVSPTASVTIGPAEVGDSASASKSTAVATTIGPTYEPTSTSAAERLSIPTAPAEPTSTLATEKTPLPSVTPDPGDTGALIQVSMTSKVGVLLDEIPADTRSRVVDDILDQPDEFWLERARRQVRLTRNRLDFRDFIYHDKGQLPLPPEELWSINLDPVGPDRQSIQGHDLVMVGYTFTSTLLTDSESPGHSEPMLEEVGGVWQEPFVFPADPDLLLQRTDNACVNEGGFPANSFDSENMWIYYDYTCQADSGGPAECHRTRLPKLSCREALDENVGEVEAIMRFERLDWDSDLANAMRVGSVTDVDSPDLSVVGEDLDTNRVIYRYIDPENCALVEGSVGNNGWRRLLQFSATVANLGGQPLNIGPVVAEDPVNHVFSYNDCHDHFHYSNYGDFSLETQDQAQSSKQAFCVQSTSRFSNNEVSPLTHSYSCRFQGIQAGWVDEYVAGLDSQWIDITDMDIPPDGLTVQLAFTSNSDQFLCEGTVVLDEDDEVIWEPSGFTTVDGNSINRPQCDFIPDWDVNNRASRDVFIPQTGSFVTEPCANSELGPLRNCGFEELLDYDQTCVPDREVEHTFRLEDTTTLQVLRVCEMSAALGSGVACTFEDSLANVLIGDDPTTIKFTCPRIRDVLDPEEPEGGYSLYTAPIWPENAQQAVVPVEG